MSLPNKQSYDNLGGELSDYSPVTDPTTDLSAEASNETRVDVAAMTRTIPRVYCSITCASSAVSISNTDYDAVFGTDIAYKPSIAYISTGIYELTWPEEIVDARGNTQTLNLRAAWVNADMDMSSFFFVIYAQVTAANKVKVYVRTASVLVDINPGRIDVFAI